MPLENLVPSPIKSTRRKWSAYQIVMNVKDPVVKGKAQKIIEDSIVLNTQVQFTHVEGPTHLDVI